MLVVFNFTFVSFPSLLQNMVLSLLVAGTYVFYLSSARVPSSCRPSISISESEDKDNFR